MLNVFPDIRSDDDVNIFYPAMRDDEPSDDYTLTTTQDL